MPAALPSPQAWFPMLGDSGIFPPPPHSTQAGLAQPSLGWDEICDGPHPHMQDGTTLSTEHSCLDEPTKGPGSSLAHPTRPWLPALPPWPRVPECWALPPPPSSARLGPCSYNQETIKLYRVRLERNRNCCSDCQKGQH